MGKRKAVSAKGDPEKTLLVAKKKRRLRCHQDGAVSTGQSGRRRHAARNMLDRGNNCAAPGYSGSAMDVFWKTNNLPGKARVERQAAQGGWGSQGKTGNAHFCPHVPVKFWQFAS